MSKNLIISALFLFSLGCQKATSDLANAEFFGIDEVPEVYEDIQNSPEMDIEPSHPDLVVNRSDAEDTQKTKEENESERRENQKEKTDSQKEQKKEKTQASLLIKAAERVRIYEGRKIGTACNLYLQRVLVVAGFPQGSFVANDFDQYAKNNFSSYKAVDFKNDRSGSDRERLRRHLWSYPERTPFILQWTSLKSYGHVAVVERIGDQLVTYQASLNRYTARRNATTVKALLNGFNRRTLTVYSEIQD